MCHRAFGAHRNRPDADVGNGVKDAVVAGTAEQSGDILFLAGPGQHLGPPHGKLDLDYWRLGSGHHSDAADPLPPRRRWRRTVE
jgi:hypothetical protein